VVYFAPSFCVSVIDKPICVMRKDRIGVLVIMLNATLIFFVNNNNNNNINNNNMLYSAACTSDAMSRLHLFHLAVMNALMSGEVGLSPCKAGRVKDIITLRYANDLFPFMSCPWRVLSL